MHAKQVTSAFVTASEVLPRQSISRKRPWISERTLQLIVARSVSRQNNDYVEEVRLNKSVRVSAKNDKREYLQTELATGSWKCVKKLKRGLSKKHADIRDLTGCVVELNERSNTLAKYFEQV